MTSGAPVLRRSIRRGRLGLLKCSSRLPGFLDVEMILGEVVTWNCFTWRLSLPM
jgi:hypothetical protein